MGKQKVICLTISNIYQIRYENNLVERPILLQIKSLFFWQKI